VGQVSGRAETRLPAELRRGLRRELLLCDERVEEGETVLDLGWGEHAGRRGVVFATDRRLVFLARERPAPVLQECAYGLIAEVQAQEEAIRIVDPAGGGASVTRIQPAGRAAELAARVEALVRLEVLGRVGLLSSAEVVEQRARIAGSG